MTRFSPKTVSALFTARRVQLRTALVMGLGVEALLDFHASLASTSWEAMPKAEVLRALARASGTDNPAYAKAWQDEAVVLRNRINRGQWSLPDEVLPRDETIAKLKDMWGVVDSMGDRIDPLVAERRAKVLDVTLPDPAHFRWLISYTTGTRHEGI